jgi:hypothetical protein
MLAHCDQALAVTFVGRLVLTVPKLALTVVEPSATPVTTPSVTVATEGSRLCHVTLDVTIAVLESE